VSHRATRAAVVLVGLASCQSPHASPIPEAFAETEPAAAVPATGAVAVVELFTSEGCSSCPPADDVLGDLVTSPGVVALAFHVDYWDDLGWPDRFASSTNTARQGSYARSFAARGVYTPQMIIGGVDQFTGSDRARADAAIARTLSHAPAVRLSLHARRADANSVAIDYTASAAPEGAVLDVAIVEHEASTQVRAGENAGRTLRHVNIVRSFAVVPLAGLTGSTTVRLPTGLRPADAELVAYVQRESTDGAGMPILGAATAPLP
jgi:hypothetical protein